MKKRKQNFHKTFPLGERTTFYLEIFRFIIFNPFDRKKQDEKKIDSFSPV